MSAYHRYTLEVPDVVRGQWPFDVEPSVGQRFTRDAHRWQSVAFVLTGRRWGDDVVTFEVTEVVGDRVHAVVCE